MTKAPTIIKYRGSITRLLQSLSTLRGLGRPSTPQDSLLADDQSLPGRIAYLQDHDERFQFCSSPFPRLTWRDTAFGNSATALAADERVRSRLSKRLLDSLSRSMNVYPQGELKDAFAGVMALHKAGVDILAGSDVSEPLPILGGLAHGASLHHELQLLVAAGLTPIEALKSATSVPARRFGLIDRGRIVPGARADLLLVNGDPTTNVADTLSIQCTWRRGVMLNSSV